MSVTRRELEQLCRARPDEPGPWLVYTDWLLEHGDPEGERAVARRHSSPTEADLLFAGRIRELAWRFGFLSAVGIRRFGDDAHAPPDELGDLTRSVLSSPVARFVDSIRFGPPGDITSRGDYDGSGDWTATMSAVVASTQAPWIRELVFDNVDYEPAGGAFHFGFGDFSSAWSRLPRLERLFIDSGSSGRLGELDLPTLRTFSFSSKFETAGHDIAAICDARWPALEYLELDVDTRSDYVGPDGCGGLERLFDGDGFPVLAHLRLGLAPRTLFGDLIGVIARSRILPRLRSLTLRTAPLDGGVVDAMVHNAAVFRHLDAIALVGTSFDVPQELYTVLHDAMPNFRGDILDSRESFDRSAC